MRDWTEDRPSLERPQSGPWVGLFPGLGSVTVDEGGEVAVAPEEGCGPDDGEDPALREAALRYGWGEALSFARRGFSLAHGAAICPPATTPAQPAETCLILTGDPHDAAIVILHLVGLGWTVMGDKYTPTLWEDGALVAHPRTAPVLVAARRLLKNEIEGVKVRAHTDARSVELPRTAESRRVAGVVSLQMRKPDEAAFEVLTGHQRFEVAASIMGGGAVRPWRADEEDPDATDLAAAETSSPGDVDDAEAEARAAEAEQARQDKVKALVAESLADHMRLSQLPSARLRMDSDTLTEDCDALLTWWEALHEGPRP